LKRLERLERIEPPAVRCLMPSSRLTPAASRLVNSARVAHLATADAAGQPHVIPICFVFDGANFYSPIDEKPKRVTASKLKRLRNIRENPRVALVIDRYDENWAELAYVLVTGRARLLASGSKHRKAVNLLRKKYSQYRKMSIDRLPMILIRPTRMTTWGAV
jgi:coenzyme F420-0:L-glutamate ligase/coenzyme F420-1:gamma-L-glutamate ligase